MIWMTVLIKSKKIDKMTEINFCDLIERVAQWWKISNDVKSSYMTVLRLSKSPWYFFPHHPGHLLGVLGSVASPNLRLILVTCYFRYLKIPSDKQLTELVFLSFWGICCQFQVWDMSKMLRIISFMKYQSSVHKLHEISWIRKS